MGYITHYHQIKKTTLRSTLRNIALHSLSLKPRTPSPEKQKRVTFTCFHSYFPDPEQNLRKQLDFLSRHFTFISYSQGVERVLNGNIDANYLCISADDGYKNFVAACKIFDEYGIKAMVFVNPAFVNETDFRKLDFYSRTRLSHPPIEFMTWNDIDKLLHRGHEIGNHTYSHFDLGTCKTEDLPEQITQSYDILKNHIGTNLHFAWPYGLYENITNDALKLIYTLGHTSAASCIRGSHMQKLDLNTNSNPFLWRHQIEPFDPIAHLKYFLT